MPIGEFGGAPGPVAEGTPVLTTPLYWMYEMGHAALNPGRAVADATRLLFQNPMNPFAQTEFGKSVAAACELFERTTRRYGKPEWNIKDIDVNGMRVPVNIHTVWEKPFCRLLYFERQLTKPLRSPHPRVGEPRGRRRSHLLAKTAAECSRAHRRPPRDDWQREVA